MKKAIVFSLFLIISCAKNTQVHPPVGGVLTEKDLETSKNRTKNLNLMERSQIKDWINHQNEKFYSTGLNYWINMDDFEQREKKKDGDLVSYQYDLYDFNQEKLYAEPTKNIEVELGKYEELKAVDDAVRFMKKGEEATLLVPSVLAFGTYGDDEKIPNDMPVIIKLKILQKNMKRLILLVLAIISITSCTPIYKKMNIDKDFYNSLQDGVYAKMETSKGELIIKFFDKDAPVTVANFVGLAEGTIENKAKAKGVPYYDGIVFHRVIKNFMIQGGDPQGTGMGDPGYKFDDEKNDIKHEGKGYHSMANSGPNTNGSQFFITEVPTPWLDGKHTVFGKVIKGEEVIDAIANSEMGAQDRPKQEIKIVKVSVFTKGDAYEKYDAAKIFNKGKGKIQENNKAYIAKQEAEAAKKLEELKAGMSKTASGLLYKISKSNPEGKAPKAGDIVAVHYAGKLTNGKEFDNSFKRGEPIEFSVGVGQVIKGWDEGILLLKEGEAATFLIPSELGYGARGAGGVIPPNAWLIFDVELVKVK